MSDLNSDDYCVSVSEYNLNPKPKKKKIRLFRGKSIEVPVIKKKIHENKMPKKKLSYDNSKKLEKL